MRQHGAQRGHDDGGKRGRKADLHQVRPAVSKAGKGVEEGRHKDDAAPHAQKPRNHARKGADGEEEKDHRQKIGESWHGGGPVRHLTLATAPAPGLPVAERPGSPAELPLDATRHRPTLRAANGHGRKGPLTIG